MTRGEAVDWMLAVAQTMGPSARFVASLLATRMRLPKAWRVAA